MLRNEVQSSNQVSDVAIDDDAGMISSDLIVNNLVYKTPAALSLAVDRTYTKMFPQNNTATNGQTTVFDLTSGTSFINPYNSYLTFDVQINPVAGATGTVAANFGLGSAMNLIQQVTIRSRSGTELQRVEHANYWSRAYHVNKLPQMYLRNQGLVEGWSPLSGLTGSPMGSTSCIDVSQSLVTSTGTSRFCLPVQRLCPFFDPVKRNCKYPPQLMSGLHIELIWESPGTAFNKTAATVATDIDNGGFTISNIAFVMDTMTLTDDTQRAINKESAQYGLELTVPSVYTDQYLLATSATQLNMQLRKAVTQANSAMLLQIPSGNINHSNLDSFASVDANATSFQYRLGSLYFPKQALAGTTGASGKQAEQYLSTLMTHDKLRNPYDMGAVSYNQYRSGGEYSLCASMEKDQTLQVSALPINNSRVLETLITVGASGFDIQCYLFLDYISVIKTFIDNASLSI